MKNAPRNQRQRRSISPYTRYDKTPFKYVFATGERLAQIEHELALARIAGAAKVEAILEQLRIDKEENE